MLLHGAPTLSLDSYVSRVLSGDYTGAGVDPPVLSPLSHRYLRAEARRRHDTPDFACPVESMRREAFLVCRVPNAPRCGVQTDRRIILPAHQDRRVEALLATHGRSHGWARRLWLPEATEADVWFATAEFVWPAATRHDPASRALAHAYAPAWFLDAVAELTDAAFHAA